MLTHRGAFDFIVSTILSICVNDPVKSSEEYCPKHSVSANVSISERRRVA